MQPAKATMRIAWVVSTLAAAAAGCDPEELQGDRCCDCVLANDCWSTESCPEDPSGSCHYTLGTGSLPAYADGDVNEVCFAVLTDCQEASCPDECAGLFDD